MKTALIIATVLGVQAPVSRVASLEQGEAVVCQAEGGCIILTKSAMRQFIAELQQAALNSCPKTKGTAI